MGRGRIGGRFDRIQRQDLVRPSRPSIDRSAAYHGTLPTPDASLNELFSEAGFDKLGERFTIKHAMPAMKKVKEGEGISKKETSLAGKVIDVNRATREELQQLPGFQAGGARGDADPNATSGVLDEEVRRDTVKIRICGAQMYWLVLVGLLAARNAGIEVPDEAIDKAINYFCKMTSSSGQVGYSPRGRYV